MVTLCVMNVMIFYYKNDDDKNYGPIFCGMYCLDQQKVICLMIKETIQFTTLEYYED